MLRCLILILLLMLSALPAPADDALAKFDLHAEKNTLVPPSTSLPNRPPDICIEFSHIQLVNGFRSRCATLAVNGGPEYQFYPERHLLNPIPFIPTWDLALLRKYWPAGPQYSQVSFWGICLRPAPSEADYLSFDAAGNGADQIYGPRGWIQPYRIGRRFAYRVWFDYSRLPAGELFFP